MSKFNPVYNAAAFWAFVMSFVAQSGCFAAQTAAERTYAESQRLFQEGRYVSAARAAYQTQVLDPAWKPKAFAQVSVALSRAGMQNLASYFFIRTLQFEDKRAIRSVLPITERLLFEVGPDLIRKFLTAATTYEDYTVSGRNAYLFMLGKEAILKGLYPRAIQYLDAVTLKSWIYPYALQLRGTAKVLAGQAQSGIDDFELCAEQSSQAIKIDSEDAASLKRAAREAQDLEARCLLDSARTYYELGQYEKADRKYDAVPKASLVWPDVPFEQAVNHFAAGSVLNSETDSQKSDSDAYNRSLGKLVTYKNPLLESVVYNPEIAILNAKNYVALCYFDDAKLALEDFDAKYKPLGIEVKRLVEENYSKLPYFYGLGKKAFNEKLQTQKPLNRFLNRFVRGPYFQRLVVAENQLQNELETAKLFLRGQGVSGREFSKVLEQVSEWRNRTIELVGGLFVRSSMMDYHAQLIAHFETVSFIKLDMLKFERESIRYKGKMDLSSNTSRLRGDQIPSRKPYQMFWTFNQEYWLDELDSYIFGLKSRCSNAGVSEVAQVDSKRSSGLSTTPSPKGSKSGSFSLL